MLVIYRRLRSRFRPWELLLLLLLFLSFVLALLAPVLGVERAFTWLVASGAALTALWIANVAYGSASPRLVLVSLTNAQDRRVAQAIAKRVDPEADTPPPTIEDVAPGESKSVMGTFANPLCVGVRHMEVTVKVDGQPSVDVRIHTPPDVSYRAESLWILVEPPGLTTVLSCRMDTADPEAVPVTNRFDWQGQPRP